MPDRPLALLMPAAGASLRMRGRDKLLEDVDGQPLLRRQVEIALPLGLPVLVTLPPHDRLRRQSLKDVSDNPNLTCKHLADAAEGLGASLRAGAAFARKLHIPGLMVVLPDLPELTTGDLQDMAAVFSQDPTRILRATDQSGRPGHPVILPHTLFDQILRLTGDTGARPLFQPGAVRLHALPGNRATCDLDTPEAWADWRANRRD